MSAKTSAQPGRRTPLSLTGAATKTHLTTKGGNNAANSGGNNANGHNAASSNANKQDHIKQQQSKTEQQQQNYSETKENPNKKHQQQADKKHQQNEHHKKSNNEKNQNGVSSNKQQQSNENKQQQQKDKQQQQQQNKDKQHEQQNGNNDNKSNEKDKKEKVEKSDKSEKSEKPQEKLEKEDSKVKEDKKLEQDKTDSKKEDKKPKEVNDNAKDDKNDVAAKNEEQTEKKDDTKSNEENQANVSEHKTEEKAENMEVIEEPQQQVQQKSPPVTPKTNSNANKTATPVNKTPTKASEKPPQKSTPSNNSAKTTPVTKRVVTTAVDEDDDDDDNDIEMEPLAIESSPVKSSQTQDVGHINIAPSATSTPGKILLSKRHTVAPKSDVQLAMQTGISLERPRAFSQISGRKSIRPISDYTPSQFQSNLQFRESYRRINTELDVTNTSMNVTVGSEVPNNLSFSFFERGRKRDRTPPQHSQSAIGELQTDMEVSPPKRARLDMYGFFSVVSSPLSLLRNRFSKATLQSSTPVKLQEKLNSSEDEIEVQNVSGVSVHEEIGKTEKEPRETKVNEDNDAPIGEEAKETKLTSDIVTPTSDAKSEGKEFTDVSLKCEKSCGMEQTCEQSDIKITETPLQPAVGEPMAKNKRCVVM